MAAATRFRAFALSTTVHALGIAAAFGAGAVHVAASWRATAAAPSRPILTDNRGEVIETVAEPTATVAIEDGDDARELVASEAMPTAEDFAPAAVHTPMPMLLPPRPSPTMTLLAPLHPKPANDSSANAMPAADPQPAAAATAATAADALVEPSPIATDNAPPSYPFVAWRRGIEGEVTVLLEIDADGAVTAAHVERSSGFAILDDAALAALARWRFAPARRGDLAVAGTLHQQVVFRLRDGADQPAR